MRIFAPLTFALFLVAGCSGSSTETPPASSTVDVDVQPTETTGIIRGVVIDQAIRPIIGATLSIAGQGASTTTNEEGAFGFEGLAPGTYFLTAHKAGYTDVQQSADVVAGLVDPDPVRIKLQADPRGTPFAEPYVLHGFLECNTSILAACAVLEVPQQTLCYGNPNVPVPPPGICLGKTTNDQFSSWQMVSPNIEFLQAELVWESTNPFGDELSLTVRGSDYGTWQQGYYQDSFGSAEGTSPVIFKMNGTKLNDKGIGNGTGDQAHGMEYDIFTGGLVGVTIEQKFDIYTTVFHGYRPPEDWSLFDAGDVPPPP